MSTTQDAAPVYQKDLVPGSGALIVSFSGLTGVFNEDRPFDFFMTTNVLGYNRIMVRDPDGSFYLKGIDANGFDHLVSRLRDDIESIKPQRTIFIGPSSGAYAAVLFGHLLGADYVHAFAPRGHFRPLKAFLQRDFKSLINRSPLMLKLPWNLPPEHRQYLDLKPLLQGGPKPQTKMVLHACAYCIDARRVQYLADCPGITIFLYPCDCHNVARVLVKSGCLLELLLEKNLDQPEEVYRAFYGDFKGNKNKKCCMATPGACSKPPAASNG